MAVYCIAWWTSFQMSSIVLKAQNRITDVAEPFLYGHFFGWSPKCWSYGVNILTLVVTCNFYQRELLCRRNVLFALVSIWVFQCSFVFGPCIPITKYRKTYFQKLIFERKIPMQAKDQWFKRKNVFAIRRHIIITAGSFEVSLVIEWEVWGAFRKHSGCSTSQHVKHVQNVTASFLFSSFWELVSKISVSTYDIQNIETLNPSVKNCFSLRLTFWGLTWPSFNHACFSIYRIRVSNIYRSSNTCVCFLL